MKILLVDNSPEMGGSMRNGAALANGLVQRGDQVALLASRLDLFANLLEAGVRTIEAGWDGFRNVFDPAIGLSGGGLPVIGQALALRRLRGKLMPVVAKAIEDFQPDLVHVNNLNLPQKPVVEAAERAGLPVVFHCRMIRSFGRVEAQMAARAARIICVSRAVRRNLLKQMRLDSDRVETVYNAVDPERFAAGALTEARAELELPSDAPVACMLGRLSPWKGHHVAIAAWRAVRQKHPQAILAVVGTGEPDYHEQCKALVGHLDLNEAVKFVGHRDDIHRVLSACDLLVHASCYDDPSRGTVEAFGRVVIEAMAAGLPVVATAVGGVPEVVENNVTGKLVRPGDPDALAAAVVAYLDDPEAAREAGFAGKRRVRQFFKVENLLDRMRELYQQVLSESGAKGYKPPTS